MDTKYDKSAKTDSKTAKASQEGANMQSGSLNSDSKSGKSGSSKSNTQTEAKRPSETQKDGPLRKFFTDGLKDVLFAENYLLDALKKMQKESTTKELEEAFEDHYLATQKHVSRLEKVFKSIGESPESKKCDAIIGIVKEAESAISDTEKGSMTRDAALIIAAQKAEHYEIATYGGLAALAETLELREASELLHRTLQEEEDTDLLLSDIAESYINFSAVEDDK